MDNKTRQVMVYTYGLSCFDLYEALCAGYFNKAAETSIREGCPPVVVDDRICFLVKDSAFYDKLYYKVTSITPDVVIEMTKPFEISPT